MDNKLIPVPIPGNNGRDCPLNGEHFDDNGKLIECCCDECDYMMCCIDDFPIAIIPWEV